MTDQNDFERNWKFAAIPPPMALPFLRRADEIRDQIRDIPPTDDLALANLRRALEELPERDLAWVLAGTATILVEEVPAVRQLFETTKIYQTRSAGAETLSSVLLYLLQNPSLIPLIAVSLRILGTNRFKFGKVEIKTESVLRELARLIPKAKE